MRIDYENFTIRESWGYTVSQARYHSASAISPSSSPSLHGHHRNLLAEPKSSTSHHSHHTETLHKALTPTESRPLTCCRHLIGPELPRPGFVGYRCRHLGFALTGGELIRASEGSKEKKRKTA